MRKSNLQLPSADELSRILASESQRKAVKHDYVAKNRSLYGVYRRAAREVGHDARWIDTYPDLTLEDLDRQVRQCTDALEKSITSLPSYHDSLFDALAIEQEPQVADGIFVFGSPSDARIKKAIQLYHQGLAPALFLSGRRPYYGTHDLPEAERMKRFAVNHGVPSDAIITENRSITLPDNVKTMLDDFEHRSLRPTRLIIVATTYILRRAAMEWYRFAPWNVETILVSADESDVSESLRHATWWRSEQGRRQLLDEYVKIIFEHKMSLE